MTRRRFLHEKLRSLYLWHRYAGLFAAILLVWLAITGIVLNHSTDLGLDRARVEAGWIQDLYGIEAPPVEAVPAGGHWLARVGDRLYFDARRVGECRERLVAAFAPPPLFLAVCRHSVVLLEPDGNPVDSLPAPAAVDAARLDAEGRLLIRSGTRAWRANEQLLDWQALEKVPAFAGEPATLKQIPSTLAERLRADYRGGILDWERVLLDAHSGRLLGRLGPWLADLAGILLLLLAVSGIIVWWQRRSRQRQHMKQ